jgi:tetratricopeptide (TPR) repeat protein
MREKHPDPAALTRYVLGELPGVECAGIERHLAACCDCRERVDEVVDEVSLPLLEGLSPGYDDAFDRALVGVAEQLAGLRRDVRRAEDLLAELLREPAPRRQRTIQEDERFHSLKLCQLLREGSKKSWFSDAAAARDFAELAVGVAERLDPARYGAGLTVAARTLSWAYLSNAYRIASDLRRAERALRQAWSHHRQGSGDLDTEGELLVFTSSLKILQGRFDEALGDADRAITVHRSLGDGHRDGSTLIKKGIALAEGGRYREAIAVTRTGLRRIDAARDPRLLLIGKQNLAWDLIENGEYGEAGRLLAELRSLGQDHDDRILHARIDWLEGCYAGCLGGFAEAESLLTGSRELFLHQELGADVLMISLHLAEVHARAGQPRKVRQLLRDVIPLGEAIGLRRESLAARLLYAQASGR